MRFATGKSDRRLLQLLAPLLTIVIGLAVFTYASDTFSKGNSERQQHALEEAVRSSSVYCYSIEGFYPPDVEYLEKHYGLSYDKTRYYVGYRLQGSNLMPEITIVPIEETP